MAIYDCFTFFNELELLELRLRILDKYVDKFVVVELPCTFRGEKKGLIFDDNKERFGKYLNKIIYICPNYSPLYKGDGDFGIEYFQRNSIIKGLGICDPDDIVMISDIDEIPNPKIFEDDFCLNYMRKKHSYKTNFKTILYELSLGKKQLVHKMLKKSNGSLSEWLEMTPISLEQNLFYYYFNCRSKGDWYGTVICKYKMLNLPQRLRDYRELFPFCQDGGWHFSYLGGIDKVKEKLASIVDKDPAIVAALRKYSNDEAYINNCILTGKDILGRKGAEFEYEFVRYVELNIPDLETMKTKYPNLFFEDSV